MPTYPLEPQDYSQLAEALHLFSEMTQIQTYFYTFDNHLLKSEEIQTDPVAIKHALQVDSQGRQSLFPVIIDHKFWGYLICDTTHTSQRRVFLAQSYLEKTLNNAIITKRHGHITVLNPLDNHQLSQINFINNLVRTTDGTTNPILTSLTTDKTVTSPAKPNFGDYEATHSLWAAIQYIDKNSQKPLTLTEVAQHVFLSPAYLSRLFKKTFKINFVDYINNQKMALACDQLIFTTNTIRQIAHQVGFNQTSYFSKLFKARTSVTPTQYKLQNANIKKSYTIKRNLDWGNKQTILDVSSQFFKDNRIPFSAQTINGYPYIDEIGGLRNSAVNHQGWVYTVNCRQPALPVSQIELDGISVIQWLFTPYDDLL